MRIGTWNREGRSAGQLRGNQAVQRAGAAADVWVLTEVAEARCGPRPGFVGSPVFASGAVGIRPACAAAAGEGLEPVGLPIPFQRLAVAARTTVRDREVVVYGSVIPWRGPTASGDHALGRVIRRRVPACAGRAGLRRHDVHTALPGGTRRLGWRLQPGASRPGVHRDDGGPGPPRRSAGRARDGSLERRRDAPASGRLRGSVVLRGSSPFVWIASSRTSSGSGRSRVAITRGTWWSYRRRFDGLLTRPRRGPAVTRYRDERGR